jgi:SanA protein
MRPLIRFLLLAAMALAVAPWLLRWWTAVRYRSRIFDAATVSPTRVAIVFGAGLRRDGSPTAILRERLEVAANLYLSGKVERLLLTGAEGQPGHNEPEAMREYARSLGVPDEVLVLDQAGFSTYDSCFRAREVYGLTQAILVTQPFHLDRALYLCDSFGLSAVGVPARLRRYSPRWQRWWDLREVAATSVAWWNVNFARPRPPMGERLRIG